MIAEIIMRLLVTSLLLSLTLPVSAQIYQYKDANGNTVYTNQPPQGQDAKQVQLPPTNSVEMSTPKTSESTAPTEQASGAHYATLALTDLPSDEALRANNGTFSVRVEITPKLAPGHRLRLLLNGKPYGQASNSTRLQLTNIDRGEHSLAVEVLSGGQSIQQSSPVTFTVQRVNTQSPALRPKPTPKPAT